MHNFKIFILFFVLTLNNIRAKDATYDNLELGIPSKCDYIINREGYALGFDKNIKQARWTIYKLTKKELKAVQFKRLTYFLQDPLFKNLTAKNQDYWQTKYDRGHLVPARDMQFSYQTMRESFYYSNVSPQLKEFNRGIWKQLEELTRQFAMKENEIYVITGTIFSNNPQTIGKNKIPIPTHFYKIIYAPNAKKMIAFLLENKKLTQKLECFVVSVDFIEELTNLDFFSKLDDDLEDNLESNVDRKYWF